MKDVKIGIPGSLDGPPDQETTTLGEKVAMCLLGALFSSVGVAVVAFVVVALLWATAWLLAHFPTL